MEPEVKLFLVALVVIAAGALAAAVWLCSPSSGAVSVEFCQWLLPRMARVGQALFGWGGR